MFDRHHLTSGLIGLGVGVVVTAIFCAMLFSPRGADYDISNLLLRTFVDPESEALAVVLGCRPDHNGRSAGDNARLAAERRLEILIEQGVYIDRTEPDGQSPPMQETLARIPHFQATQRLIDRELRESYGCVSRRAFTYPGATGFE